MTDAFSDEQTLRDVIQHMNEDHHDACLVIAQDLGNETRAVKATMLGMNTTGIDFSVVDEHGNKSHVRVDFDKEITRDSQIRGHLVALTKRARARLEQ